MVGSCKSGNIANRWTVRTGGHVLEGCPHMKVVILVQEVADIRQAIAAPATTRAAGVATLREWSVSIRGKAVPVSAKYDGATALPSISDAPATFARK